jgi:outer membrane receptor protein involved in Fe transport
MRYIWFRVFILACLVALPVQLALSANGKIRGTVRDAATKQAIPGANVLVVGTTQGGAADAEGHYYVLNVNPGKYSVQCSGVGFRKEVVQNVTVSLDQTVELNFDLNSEAVEVSEVVVSAERRVVDKNRTSTKTTITSDEIQSLPAVTVLDLLNTSPSAFNGFVRGGGITETKTIVEGVDISNQMYEFSADNSNQSIIRGSASVVRNNQSSQLSTNTNINMSSVEQFALNTGATGAEYSSATAGTISYALKEGSGPLTGSLQARASQPSGLTHGGPDVYNLDKIYFDEKAVTNTRLTANVRTRDSIKAAGGTPPSSLQGNITSDSIRSTRYTYYPGKYSNQNKPLLDFEGSLGGNITEDFRAFFTGRYYDSHGYFPNERNRQADISLKATYSFSNNIKLTGFGIVNDKGKLFGWKNTAYADQTRYFLEGTPENNGLDWVGSLKLTQVLTPSTFYEVQLSQTYHNVQQGYVDANNDGFCAIGEKGDFLTFATQDQINKYISTSEDLSKFFRVGDEAGPSQINQPMCIGNTQAYLARPQAYYENTTAIARTLKADLTSQVDFHHQLKAGVQMRLHDIDKILRVSMLGANATDSRGRLMVDSYHFYPTEGAAYASDRMEFGGLVINAGLRLERWDPKAPDYYNYFNPYRVDTVDYDGQMRRTNVAVRSQQNLPAKWFLSPRIGVSHPISDRAALFYSYSRQAIPPPFARLYASFNTVFGAPTSFPNFVSLNQDLTKSSNYEIGVQWEVIPEKLGINATAYMRDVQNYAYPAVTIGLPSGQSTWWLNAGYADARGLEFTATTPQQRYFDFLGVSGRVSYAYTYVKASSFTNNDPTQPTLFPVGDSSKYNLKLPIGDFAYYNKIQNDVSGGQSTLTGGYDRTHRVTYSLAFTFPLDFMLTSLGTFQSGFYYPVYYPADARVAGRQLATSPWNKMVDLRLEKGFRFGSTRLAIFAEVKNLFNWVNIIGYDNTVSGAQLWEQTNSGNGTTLPNATNSGPDPTGNYKRALGQDGSWFYDIPREYYLGVRLDI